MVAVNESHYGKLTEYKVSWIYSRSIGPHFYTALRPADRHNLRQQKLVSFAATFIRHDLIQDDLFMARLLFRLTNVPDDEAMEIRQLLEENAIHFYETDAGRWKVGVDAIWLPDDTQYGQARAILDDYQQERTKKQQLVYAELEASGEAPTLAQKIAAHPIRFLAQVIAIIFILCVSIVPFWFAFH